MGVILPVCGFDVHRAVTELYKTLAGIVYVHKLAAELCPLMDKLHTVVTRGVCGFKGVFGVVTPCVGD
jgi:hypothetical protein